MLSSASTFAAARQRPSPSGGWSAATDQPIQVVLAMLWEQAGMDVVFVRQFSEGRRRFRMVESLGHGPAAALATGHSPDARLGELMEVAVVLRDGRVHGHLCGLAPTQDPAERERRSRALCHGARLAARLLDQDEVLRQLSRQAL